MKKNIRSKKIYKNKLLLVLILFILVLSNENIKLTGSIFNYSSSYNNSVKNLDKIPYEVVERYIEYIPEENELYQVVNNNRPFLSPTFEAKKTYRKFSYLDIFGRAGQADSIISFDDLPKVKRQNISHIKPSGWNQKTYDFIKNDCLYNRCHLIAYQLCGENDNILNLITGTTSFNNKGMRPFENMVKDHIKLTRSKVRYRVTPVYKEQNLVAKGVFIEAYSIQDAGAAISFNVFVFNTQPGVTINYQDGSSFPKKVKRL